MRRFLVRFRAASPDDDSGAGPYFVPAADLNQSWLLRDWMWLVKTPHEVLLVTALGDMFLSDESGHVFCLDTTAGGLREAAASEEEFAAKLNDPACIEEWFNPDLIDLLRARGKRLRKGECYSFDHPPILGGEVELSNIKPSDVYTHVGIMGQIHRQVKDLPPGTVITGIDINNG